MNLYAEQILLNYKGHTIVTLLDLVDHDWSWVAKRGHYETNEQMQHADGHFAGSGVSLRSREAALEAAKAFVDAQP